MRAGPLSSNQIIEKLNSEFINTWIIIPQFEKPEDFFQDSAAREWAKTIQKEFTYPVDTIILSSKGEPLAQGEYNNVNSVQKYEEMLEQVTGVGE